MTTIDSTTGTSVSTIPCAGWEDEESPKPTCFPHGCARLDENGSCPGNVLSPSGH